MVTKQEIMDEYGEEFFESFQKWMYGQTTGVIGDYPDGEWEPDYYRWDVDRFVSQYNENFRLLV